MPYLDSTGLNTLWAKIKSLVSGKQDKLTAGTNISIDANNVISATGGGTSNHASLTNLAYANSGHTGFQAEITSSNKLSYSLLSGTPTIPDISGKANKSGDTFTGDVYFNASAYFNSKIYGPAVGSNPRNQYGSEFYFFNCDGSTTSPYCFGLYQWDNVFQFTTRTSSNNVYKSTAFEIDGNTGATDYKVAPTLNGSRLVPTNISAFTNDAGYTKNTGTVTSVAVKMNGSTKGTVTSSGTIDLGTVLTSHQSLSNYVTTNTAQTISAAKTIQASDGGQASNLKVLSTSTTSVGDSNWRGRFVCGAENLTFLMGTYNGIAGIGAHSWSSAASATGAAWADMYLNPDGDKSVYIGKKKSGTGWTASSGILQINNDDGKVYTYGNLLVTGNSSDTPLSIRTAAVGGGCYMGFRGSTGDALGYFGVTVTGTPVFYRSGDRVIAMMDYANSGLFTATRFKTTGAQTGTSSTANARISTSGSYQYELVYTASSKYLKHDIKNVEDFDCTALYNLPVRQFVWNDDENGTPTLGLVADEVAENFRIGAMYRDDYRGGKDPSDWDERIMIPAMLKLIQEQHEELEMQRNEIDELKSRLDDIEGRL